MVREGADKGMCDIQTSAFGAQGKQLVLPLSLAMTSGLFPVRLRCAFSVLSTLPPVPPVPPHLSPEVMTTLICSQTINS